MSVSLPPAERRVLPEISQFALSRFERCERLFELAHLRREPWPAPDPLDEQPDLRRRLAVGELFHRLVHWHARGLDPERFLDVLGEGQDAAELRRHWQGYLASPYATLPAGCWSEQTLRVTVAGLRLQVRYDRLARLDDGRWVIFDWKTGRAFDAAGAQGSWQTRLYRLALALGGQAFNAGRPIAPERVTVAYWHVPSAEVHELPYSEALMAEDERAVSAIAERLRGGLEGGFAANAHHCVRCVYKTRCQLAAERPAAEASPPVWPTFKFPD